MYVLVIISQLQMNYQQVCIKLQESECFGLCLWKYEKKDICINDPRHPFLAYYFTASFNAFAALNFGAFEAAISRGSLVAGLIPIRAGRSLISNFPKPEISTFPPSDKVFAISSKTVSTATVHLSLSFPISQQRLLLKLFYLKFHSCSLPPT